MNKRTKLFWLVGIVLAAGFFVLSPKSVMALNSSSIVTKAKLEGVWSCYNSAAYAKSWKASELKSNFVKNDGSSDAVKLPYGLGGIKSNAMDCRQVMFGNSGGLLPANIKNIDVDLDSSGKTIADYFKGLGYEAKAQDVQAESEAEQLTYAVTAYNGGSISYETKIVFPAVGIVNGGLSVDQSVSYNVPEPGSVGSKKFEFKIAENTFSVLVRSIGSADQPAYEMTTSAGNVYNVTLNSGGGYDFNADINVGISGQAGASLVLTGNTSKVSTSGEGHAVEYFILWQGDPNNLIKGLNSSFASYNDLALTKQEVYDLYRYYVEDVFKAKVICENDSDYENYSHISTYINWNTCGKCKIDTSGAADVLVYGVDSNYHLNKTVGLNDIIMTLSGMTIDGLSGASQCSSKVPGSGSGETTTETSGEFKCDEIVKNGDKGKIGAMQWILCPTLDNGVYTANWIDDVTQKALEVNSDVYRPGSEVQTIWESIRNVANVMMVVFLLVVIVSQVTGRGIDNYGIKKMLPRLIVMAIVVNLSFYICAIAIDLSNILGSGLRNLFGSIGGDGGTSGFMNMMMGLFGVGSTSAGAAVSAGTLAATLGAGGWIPLVIGAIVLVFVTILALVVLWLMLGARMVIIVFCVAVSPLAFAAFILPNTQNLFKKWWQLFQAAIIIFPICGAVAGISTALKGVEFGGVFGAAGELILIVLPYLVFFLLPMLLKNALAALGKVGGALTALGNTARSGSRAIGQNVMKGAQNTETYKTIQAEAARRRQSQSAQRTIDRLNRIKDKKGELNSAETRQLARAHEVQRKLQNEESAARTILADKEYAGIALDSDNANDDTLIKRWESAWQNGNADEMDALTNVIVSRHGPGGVNAIASRLAEADIFDNDGGFRSENMERSFNALRANLQQNSALASAMQNKAADVYQMMSSGGFVEHDKRDANGNVIMESVLDNNGQVIGQRAVRETTRANLRDHSANNSIATQDKDWATQSSATLKRAVESGALTQSTAQRILNSTDPAIQSGIKSDASKRRVLEAAAGGYTGGFQNAAEVDAGVARYQAQGKGFVSAEYANRSADDVYDEAMTEYAVKDEASRQAEEARVQQEQAEYERQEAARRDRERQEYEQMYGELLEQRDREQTMENNRRMREALENIERNTAPSAPRTAPQTPANPNSGSGQSGETNPSAPGSDANNGA